MGKKQEKAKKFHHRQTIAIPFLIFPDIQPTSFAGGVNNPPSIATANAKKNHFSHHRAVYPVVGGGPVGRAGRDPTSLEALDSLDF